MGRLVGEPAERDAMQNHVTIGGATRKPRPVPGSRPFHRGACPGKPTIGPPAADVRTEKAQQAERPPHTERR